MATSVQVPGQTTAKPEAYSSIKGCHDDFVMTAHDLRNPLACIISSLELLDVKMKTGRAVEAARIIDRGIRAAERIEEMLQDALAGRRVEGLLAKSENTHASLLGVCKKAVEFNQSTAEQKGIAIDIVGDEFLVEVDPSLLLEALDNLLSNAVKYSFPDSVITCRIVVEAHAICIQVIDEGSGLTVRDLQRIGEPFQKLSARPTNGESSTGLGLWSVKRIVKMLDGELQVMSPGSGKGATFTIRLPQPVIDRHATHLS